MPLETPWSHLQRVFAERQPFEAALPGLQAHDLSGEDVGVLLSDPSSPMAKWMRAGTDTSIALSAAEPPSDAALPAARSGKRGFLGWLSGATAAEGLGLFTETDVFEFRGVQFAVLPEPLRPVVFGELVPLRVLALNCTADVRTLTVDLDAGAGVLQSPRRYALSLEPGVISLAVLPARVCPSTPAVVVVQSRFDVDENRAPRRLNFGARPYARPPDAITSVMVGASMVAAATGVSPVYLRRRGPVDQGSPDAVRLRADLSSPLVASQQAPVLWRLKRL
jgi:hypothetical protein